MVLRFEKPSCMPSLIYSCFIFLFACVVCCNLSSVFHHHDGMSMAGWQACGVWENQRGIRRSQEHGKRRVAIWQAKSLSCYR
jgi:hypothetical protein